MYLNDKAVKHMCHELSEAQVSAEFMLALDLKVRDIIEKSCAYFQNKKRITEMITK